jgi:L-threonylcarbamoyladenylate synthase
MAILTPSQETYVHAAKILSDGGVVSFPTETVYGLGCDIYNESAIDLVYTLKNRPKNNPMIAHVLDLSWTDQICTGWNDTCDKLVARFWPGPLTIVVPKKDSVPKEACGGFNTIAIRCPSHQVARAFLTEFGRPVSAPSANRSGHISPTSAQHVVSEFGDSVEIIDGGHCEKGIESTVISMVENPTILRFGSITVEEIQQTIGDVDKQPIQYQTNSPGTSTRHYAPNTKAFLYSQQQLEKFDATNCVVISILFTPTSAKHHFQMPSSAHEYAKKLYSVLREADEIGADQIIVERPPQAPEWNAVNDRLRRCCFCD